MIQPLNIKVVLPYSTYFFSLDMLNKSQKITCYVKEPTDGMKVKYEFKSQEHAWLCLKDKIRESENIDIEIS